VSGRAIGEKFPEDFLFRLTEAEVQELRNIGRAAPNRSQIVTGSQRHKGPRFLPYAFTEHGDL